MKKFAWFPLIVRTWSSNYKKRKLIWLRYFYSTEENKLGYEAFDKRKKYIPNIKYVIR